MPADPAAAAAIFDLDGLLVDSEPLWVRAELECFAAVGLRLQPAECAQTTGLRIDEVVAYWHDRRPWQGQSQQAVADAIIDRVEQLLSTEVVARPGAVELVRRLAQAGVPLAVASSSAPRLIDAALGRIGLADLLPLRCSAADQPYGKPHPAVYLAAASALGMPPDRCIALEDSLNGVIAAAAARMGVIAVPEAAHRTDPRFRLADLVLSSLVQLDMDAWRTVVGLRLGQR